MSRLPRATTWLVTLLVVALVAGGLLGLWTVRRSFPQVSGELDVFGLDGHVAVVRDEWGVPHILRHSRDGVLEGAVDTLTLRPAG